MLIRSRPLALVLGLFALLPSSASADPVTISNAVAPALPEDGGGLCSATAISESPAVDFGFLNTGNYISSMNSFMEAHELDRVESTLMTPFDLSNNNASGLALSYGDFVDAVPGCSSGGCDFYINDTTTSFGARLRGYLNVTDYLVDKPVHFGFYADDSVSLTFFDSNANAYPVVIRAPQLGAPTWRLTETVTFTEPGLYPLEILYVEIVEHSALEISYFIGDFTDFERPANQAPVVQLDEANFTLFVPEIFFQTISGSQPFAQPEQCKQCDRQYVNLPGNNGCSMGYYCNEAALCAPCDTAIFCGETCSPCGGDSPFCINLNGDNVCAQCRDNNDCPSGYLCDPETHTCHECNTDDDCGRGQYCEDNYCVDCNTADSCAGNSCNCCPQGSDGTQMECAPVDQDGPPVCVECLENGDCASGICDVLVGHCVDELHDNERPDCCGDHCVACPIDHPYCLPGPFGTACAQCRWDTDCEDGAFCLSGQCQPCTFDKRCGLRCESCGGDTPFCLEGQTAEQSVCVGCTEDSQCGSGATCNQNTKTCQAPACMMSCASVTPYCYEETCVECYADSQCPCGGTCDLDTNTCSVECSSNVDCLGNEHCRWDDDFEDKECALGPMPGDVMCGSTLASACDTSIAPWDGRHRSGLWLVGLAMLALLFFRRRRRGQS